MENVDDIYPLSPMQELMLMHSLRVHGSSTLINQFRYRLTGSLDVGRFSQAWQQAVDRHPALRTAFVWEEVEQPVQVVRSRVRVPLEFFDLSKLDATERDQRAEEIQRSDRERGFDLIRAPLMRLTLIKLASMEHLFLWSRHHLIIDLWSVENLFAEVFETYKDPNEGPESKPAGFRDYIAWLDRQDLKQAQDFWTDYLADCQAPTLLFTKRARRSKWSRKGQPITRLKLDATLGDKLGMLARKHGLTLSTLIQGALALVMAVRVGRDDVMFGLTVSGRPRDLDQVEQIMGSFINNVPVRICLDPAMSVHHWLAGIQGDYAKRMPFEYVSPVDIQTWSCLPPQLPQFDLLLLLQSPSASHSDLIGIESLPGPFDSALPLTLAYEPGAAGIRMSAVYDDTVVSAHAAAGLLNELHNALERLVAHPDATLARVLPDGFSCHAPDGTPPSSIITPDETTADTEVGNVLLDIWRRTLGIPEIGLDDDFFALGGTSLQAAMAFSEIERRLGKVMSLSTLFSAGSVRKLMAALELPIEPASSLVTIQRLGQRPPVLAMAGIGGNVVGLSGVARALGECQPFFGLQSKGLYDDDAPASTVEDIAEDLIIASESLCRGPIALLGICFGANVMLEMAHQLEQQGSPPDLLIVLDPVYDQESERGEQSAAPPPGALLSFVAGRLRSYLETYKSLDRGARRQWFKEKTHTLLGKIRHRDILRGNRLELRQRRVEAANLAAARRYEPRPYAGNTRVLLTADRVINLARDPRQNWVDKLVPGAVTQRIPGRDTGDAVSHHAAILARHVQEWIDELDGD